MNKAKNYVEMGEIFGLRKGEVERLEKEGDERELEEMAPRWKERREVIEKESRREKNTK